MKLRSWIIGALILLVLLPALGLGVFVLTFNPNRYAPQVIAAVEKATGRQLTLGEPIQLKLSLVPTIEASNVSLANPPGFAGPDFLTLRRVEARIRLLPLLSHHLDIINLLLDGPRFTLETNAAGQGDWDFSPAQPAQPAGPTGLAQNAAPAPRHIYSVELQAVEISDGVLTLQGAERRQPTVIALQKLTGTAPSLTAPMNIAAQAVYDNVAFTLSGIVGPAAQFTNHGPWPVDLALAAAAGTLNLRGVIADPAAAGGYDFTATAAIPALEAITPLLPLGFLGGFSLPAFHGITASARIVDQSSPIPAIDNLSVQAGPSDLSALRPGLMLAALDLEMASLDQPFHLTASGSQAAMPLSFHGDFGPFQALLNPALLPASMPPQVNFPVTMQAAAGAATLSVTGAIATPATLSGVALAVNAGIPDLAALTSLAGTSLPTWKHILFQTTLIDPGGLGLHKAIGLDSLAVTMDNATFGGDASLYFGAQPRLQAALSAQQIDLDRLIAAWPQPSAPPPAASVPPAPSPVAATSHVIPTQKLPLNILKTGSADIQLAADHLIYGGATYNALQGHAVLAQDVLTLNPMTGEFPGGSFAAAATLDATQEPARASVSINAPALALSPFLKAIGLPDAAQGTAQGTAKLSGTGDSLHDLAGTMNGQIGLASVNGIIDGSVLNRLFGAALGAVGLPAGLIGAQGPVALRCFGLRIDAANGVGTIRALTMDSSRLLVQGGGGINFGPETLAVVLRPQLRVAGSPVGVPVQIGGTFASPVYTVAPQAALQAAADAARGLTSTLLQRAGGGNSVLGSLVAAAGLGNDDACPAALNLARLGQPGPAAAAAAAAAAKAAPAGMPAPGGPKNLLDALFGK